MAVLVTVSVTVLPAPSVTPETPETPETVSVTPETTPLTVPVTPPRRPGASALSAASAASVVVSGTERVEADSSSALAAAEPSAQAPVTPAAMTIERRMFLFMRASDP